MVSINILIIARQTTSTSSKIAKGNDKLNPPKSHFVQQGSTKSSSVSPKSPRSSPGASPRNKYVHI